MKAMWRGAGLAYGDMQVLLRTGRGHVANAGTRGTVLHFYF